MFAVLKTGGKQYKVTSGDVLKVEKLAANEGETVQFNDILVIKGKKLSVGSPLIFDAAVQAEVVAQIRGEKVINFVKRRRKHSSQRTKGHRQYLTVLRVTNILESGAAKSGIASAQHGAGFVTMVSGKDKKEAAAQQLPKESAGIGLSKIGNVETQKELNAIRKSNGQLRVRDGLIQQLKRSQKSPIPYTFAYS